MRGIVRGRRRRRRRRFHEATGERENRTGAGDLRRHSGEIRYGETSAISRNEIASSQPVVDDISKSMSYEGLVRTLESGRTRVSDRTRVSLSRTRAQERERERVSLFPFLSFSRPPFLTRSRSHFRASLRSLDTWVGESARSHDARNRRGTAGDKSTRPGGGRIRS